MNHELSQSAAGTADNRLARRLAAVILFAILTAISAVVEVPLPGTPVPVTLQTMIVSLAGLLLGPMLGASSQILYVGAGALGAPVFAGGAMGIGHLLGPTGGYLLAFPVAAAVTGRLAGPVPAKWHASALGRMALAILIGTAVILAIGAAQLALLTGDAGRAVQLGVLPFIAGDLVKVGGALLVGVRFRARTLGWL